MKAKERRGKNEKMEEYGQGNEEVGKRERKERDMHRKNYMSKRERMHDICEIELKKSESEKTRKREKRAIPKVK